MITYIKMILKNFLGKDNEIIIQIPSSYGSSGSFYNIENEPVVPLFSKKDTLLRTFLLDKLPHLQFRINSFVDLIDSQIDSNNIKLEQLSLTKKKYRRKNSKSIKKNNIKLEKIKAKIFQKILKFDFSSSSTNIDLSKEFKHLNNLIDNVQKSVSS